MGFAELFGHRTPKFFVVRAIQEEGDSSTFFCVLVCALFQSGKVRTSVIASFALFCVAFFVSRCLCTALFCVPVFSFCVVLCCVALFCVAIFLGPHVVYAPMPPSEGVVPPPTCNVMSFFKFSVAGVARTERKPQTPYG